MLTSATVEGRVARNLKVSTAMRKRPRGTLRKNNSHLRVIAGAPPLPIKRTDTPDDSSESHQEGRIAAVQRGWLRQFGRLRKSDPDLTLTEIRSIEAQVRKKLYP